jgi:hypothetical protein
MGNKKSKSKCDPKNMIPVWEGWSDYFSSAEGRTNICNMLNIFKNDRLRRIREETLADYDGDIDPSELAIELISIDPKLKEFIPANVLNNVGDVSAAVDLAGLKDDPHILNDIRQSIRTSIVLMSHGVSCVRISYTGGSDQCDPNGFSIIHHPIGSKKETIYDGEELSDFMSAWGIDVECFWVFCNDSGAGDGTGYWTAEIVAELMPDFNGYTSEGDFVEYECERCNNPQSSCTCVYDETTGDYITLEEAQENKLKKQAGGGR